MKLLPTFLFIPIAALALFFVTGCDSKQENQTERAGEAKADAIEEQADATRKSSEVKADALEDKADGVRKATDR